MNTRQTLDRVLRRADRTYRSSNRARPADEAEIRTFVSQFRSSLGFDEPKDLISFFTLANGFNFNGAFFWPCKTDAGESFETSWRSGVIERTHQFWADFPQHRPYVQIGAYEDGWFVYDPRATDYVELEGTGDVLHRFASFDDLFAYAFKDRLGDGHETGT